jgi:hypothetical protein
MTRRILVPLLLLALGLAAWSYAISQLGPSAIGSYGLLASAGVWFPLGLAALLVGFVIELRRRDFRGWLLVLYLAGLIVAIHTTVPIVYAGTPEYAWAYKHIGVAQALGSSGRVTDPSDIYQRWPVLFAATAGVGALGHAGPLSFAAWAPVAFELADALVLLGVFSLLARDRRVAFLAVLLFVCLVSWVGQDYLSPQAFGYLLWLGIVLIFVRWLRAPAPNSRGRHARLRAPLLAGLEAPPETTPMMRAVAVALVAVLFFAIVAAHQLTPYMALVGVGALTLLDLVRPRWLVLLLTAIAVAYLAPRYSFIAQAFGGIFSGSNPIQNASGVGLYHAGAQATTAWCVRGVAVCMWLLALAAIAYWRRTPGRVAIPAALAFSPFLVLAVQSYGGEAIYRVYLFSAPWCALLIASLLCELRVPLRRWLTIGVVCTAALFLGLQGLYGPARVNSFTSAELAASLWLNGHIPRGSLIVLPVGDFPILHTADHNAYDWQTMPSYVLLGGRARLNQADLDEVDSWVASLGHRSVYVVVSRSMYLWSEFYGSQTGFLRMVREMPTTPRWAVAYSNADVTIYRLDLR